MTIITSTNSTRKYACSEGFTLYVMRTVFTDGSEGFDVLLKREEYSRTIEVTLCTARSEEHANAFLDAFAGAHVKAAW